MEYAIECVATEEGWRYRVDLYCGKVRYKGDGTYASYRRAKEAAEKTGASKRKEEV